MTKIRQERRTRRKKHPLGTPRGSEMSRNVAHVVKCENDSFTICWFLLTSTTFLGISEHLRTPRGQLFPTCATFLVLFMQWYHFRIRDGWAAPKLSVDNGFSPFRTRDDWVALKLSVGNGFLPFPHPRWLGCSEVVCRQRFLALSALAMTGSLRSCL